MKISVVIPTYNASNVIEATLQSVIKQTVVPFEIVIVDDGSSDIASLEAVLDTFQLHNIVLIKKNENTNAADSRNIGAQRATGELLCFLDADDYWHPKKIETQLEAFEPNTVVSCKVQAVNAQDNKSLNVKSTFNHKESFCTNLFGSLSHNLAFQTSTLMIARSDFIRIGGFNSELPRHQDYQFIISAEAFGLKLKFIDLTLVDYIKSGKVNKTKHNWSLEKSLYFFDAYLLKQPRHVRENFLIVQLLGPSLQSSFLQGWFAAVRSRNLFSARFIFKSLIYVLRRVTS